MLGIREIYDNEKNVGVIVSYSPSNEYFNNYNLEKENIIMVLNGEIVFASLIKNNIYNLDNKNWYILEKLLELFLKKDFNYLKVLVNYLNEDSLGYKLIKQIIEEKINELKIKEEDLKLILKK